MGGRISSLEAERYGREKEAELRGLRRRNRVSFIFWAFLILFVCPVKASVKLTQYNIILKS
jgi:hypothetical protein